MGEERREGSDTRKRKKRCSKRLSCSGSAKSSIWEHFFTGKKRQTHYLGLALPKDFASLTIFPKWQAPNGQSVPQASNAPPSPSALRPACNGLVVPPPPTESPVRGKLGGQTNLGTPPLPPTLPRHPGALAGRVSSTGTAHLHRPRRLVAPPLRS